MTIFTNIFLTDDMFCCSNQNLPSSQNQDEPSQRPLDRPRSRSRSRTSRSRWSLFGRTDSGEREKKNSLDTSPSNKTRSPLLRRLSRSPRRRERASSLPGRSRGTDAGCPASQSAPWRSTADTRGRSASPCRRVEFTPETTGYGAGDQGYGSGHSLKDKVGF